MGRKLRWARQPVSQPERPSGSPSIMEVRDAATDYEWMSDDPWVMGLLEPFLLLPCIAVIGVLLELL